jgi:hypothetical protein
MMAEAGSPSPVNGAGVGPGSPGLKTWATEKRKGPVIPQAPLEVRDLIARAAERGRVTALDRATRRPICAR